MTPGDAVDPTPSGTTLGAAVPRGPRTSGLTTAEAAARLAEEGPNAIGGGSRRTLAAILISQVASPLVLILVAASLVSLVVGDAVTTAIILAIVALSATLGFVQEARSESAVAALQARLTLNATVVRDGTPRDVPLHDMVRDDLVVLGAGDIVPADGRVVEADRPAARLLAAAGRPRRRLPGARRARQATVHITHVGGERAGSDPSVAGLR